MLDRMVNRIEVTDSAEAVDNIRGSVVAPQKISSFTHNFYKYPACFPETFPRSVIRSFSQEGDWILDPFVGGGTTAVEALAANRNFVGSDINDLAIFVSRFKTTILDASDLSEVKAFLKSFKLRKTRIESILRKSPFFENIPKEIINFVIGAKEAINQIKRPRAKIFCLGVLLRLIQLELQRDYEVIYQNIEIKFLNLLDACLDKNLRYQSSIMSFNSDVQPTSVFLKADVSHSEVVEHYSHAIHREFDLVVTSPPYPGRHILYNKWQIQGRSETRLPYWIIDSRELHTESHYTMGGRDSQVALEVYLSLIHSCYENINKVLKKGGLVVQVVAFNEIKSQLYGFLDAMNAAGFEEVRNIDRGSYDGRLWRMVPHQKWYNRNKGSSGSCKEVVLFHRKK